VPALLRFFRSPHPEHLHPNRTSPSWRGLGPWSCFGRFRSHKHHRCPSVVAGQPSTAARKGRSLTSKGATSATVQSRLTKLPRFVDRLIAMQRGPRRHPTFDGRRISERSPAMSRRSGRWDEFIVFKHSPRWRGTTGRGSGSGKMAGCRRSDQTTSGVCLDDNGSRNDAVHLSTTSLSTVPCCSLAPGARQPAGTATVTGATEALLRGRWRFCLGSGNDTPGLQRGATGGGRTVFFGGSLWQPMLATTEEHHGSAGPVRFAMGAGEDRPRRDPSTFYSRTCPFEPAGPLAIDSVEGFDLEAPPGLAGLREDATARQKKNLAPGTSGENTRSRNRGRLAAGGSAVVNLCKTCFGLKNY